MKIVPNETCTCEFCKKVFGRRKNWDLSISSAFVMFQEILRKGERKIREGEEGIGEK